MISLLCKFAKAVFLLHILMNLLAVATFAQTNAKTGTQALTEPTNSEEISLTVTVTNRQRDYVHSLGKSSFSVYLDNMLQEITSFSNDDIPASIGILFDTSGSRGYDVNDIGYITVS